MRRNFHGAAGVFFTGLTVCAAVFFAACSFDYGASSTGDNELPDVVMNDVQYVRVRDGNPQVRFEAEGAERYESRQTMELKNFSFEQFNTASDTVNAMGHAGNASVELDSGNIHMKNGVRIEVDSEDIAIETKTLEWMDKERQLSTGAGEPVGIHRTDGTSFTGWGFSADARRRTWAFTSGVQGIYIDKDDDEEGEPPDAEETAEAPADIGPQDQETPEEPPEAAPGFEDTAK